MFRLFSKWLVILVASTLLTACVEGPAKGVLGLDDLPVSTTFPMERGAILNDEPFGPHEYVLWEAIDVYLDPASVSNEVKIGRDAGRGGTLLGAGLKSVLTQMGSEQYRTADRAAGRVIVVRPAVTYVRLLPPLDDVNSADEFGVPLDLSKAWVEVLFLDGRTGEPIAGMADPAIKLGLPATLSRTDEIDLAAQNFTEKVLKTLQQLKVKPL